MATLKDCAPNVVERVLDNGTTQPDAGLASAR